MRNNLTKKQVGQVPTLELAMRFNRLILMGETMPAGVITMAAAREILWIEDQLRERLIAAIGHNFYPPDGVAKPTMADMRARLASIAKPVLIPKPKPVVAPIPKPIPEAVQPAVQTEGKLRFKVAIINSMGSTVSTLNLHVDGKGEAEEAAKKAIKQLGLKKATHKIT